MKKLDSIWAIKHLATCINKWLLILVKANYHEFPVLDKKGNIVSYEFFTTHGESLIRINTTRSDGDKNNQE